MLPLGNFGNQNLKNNSAFWLPFSKAAASLRWGLPPLQFYWKGGGKLQRRCLAKQGIALGQLIFWLLFLEKSNMKKIIIPAELSFLFLFTKE